VGYKRRVWYPGAKYHITSRGNKKRDIFLDRLDYRVFVAILKDVIENNYYNLTVNRYIHLNPVKDNLAVKPGDYQWSSYKHYLGLEKNDLIDEGEIMSYFGGKRSLYNEFIMSFA